MLIFQFPLTAFIIVSVIDVLMNKDILNDCVHLLFAHLMYEWQILFVVLLL
jgi:hypothetical protein